jgi:site-specific recombinase XerD
MRYAAQQEPTALAFAHRVLAIPMKRFDRPLLTFLTPQEGEAILAATDPTTESGQRDHLLLNLLYHTGARVSEMLAVQRQDLSWSPLALIQLHGKGRKQRAIPLPKTLLPELKSHWAQLPDAPISLLFCNRFGQGLTRSGVEKRLRQTVQRAARQCPSLKERAISPHTFRHACAMHLLQAKVDITLIALFLGHESPCTTHHYIELDLQMKKQCLDKLPSLGTKPGCFKPSEPLMEFLRHL